MNATHSFSNSFLYEQCDVPPGKSLQEWRRNALHRGARDRRPSVVARLHLAPRGTPTPAR